MVCPDCGQDFSVERTMRASDVVIRVLVSKCGARFESKEKITARLNARSNTLPVQKPPLNESKTAAKRDLNSIKTDGEIPFGGAVGGSDLSLFSSSPDPEPSQQSGSGARAIRRGRKDMNDYPLPFLVLWGRALEQGKCGNKLPAFKSWERIGADDHLNALILTRFEEWMKTDAWKRGFNQHLVTWLNQKGWETPPTAKDFQPAETGNARPSANGNAMRDASAYCAWHSKPGTNNKPSHYPKSDCPECKHCSAMNGTRVSDLYQEDPMVTEIKRNRGLL